MKDELIAGIGTLGSALGSASLGSVTIATLPMAVTTTVPAGGVLGWLGVTTTATTVVAAPVAVPVAGVIAVGAFLTYGGYKAYKLIKSSENN